MWLFNICPEQLLYSFHVCMLHQTPSAAGRVSLCLSMHVSFLLAASLGLPANQNGSENIAPNTLPAASADSVHTAVVPFQTCHECRRCSHRDTASLAAPVRPVAHAYDRPQHHLSCRIDSCLPRQPGSVDAGFRATCRPPEWTNTRAKPAVPARSVLKRGPRGMSTSRVPPFTLTLERAPGGLPADL